MARSYRETADNQNAKLMARYRAERDLGPLPPVADVKKRRQAKNSLLYFLRQFLPEWFKKEFSSAHKDMIARIERSILTGTKFAYAFPRGFGKTSVMLASMIWAVLNGHSRCVVYIASSDSSAAKAIKIIYNKLRKSELLRSCYPELVCLWKLDGETKRQNGQTVEGVKTEVRYVPGETLEMPQLAGVESAGAKILATSIESKFRGILDDAGGDLIRPDLVVLDDLQTDEAARSPNQIAKIMNTIDQGVYGLREFGGKMAMFFIGTVIAKGDLCETFLDHDLNPTWRGVRRPAVESMPKNLQLWETGYRQAWLQSIELDDNYETAKRYYRANRQALEEGAKALWPANIPDDCVSNLECLMRIYLEKPKTFFSEYQLEPQVEVNDSDQIILHPANLTHLPRYVVPGWATQLVAGVDVGKYMASYVVLAVKKSDFTAAVVDYGTFPEQSTIDFKYKLAQNRWGGTTEKTEPQLIKKGLLSLVYTLRKRWRREDGNTMLVNQMLIDRGYQPFVIKDVCQEQHVPYILPVKGYGSSPTRMQLSEWKPKAGIEKGDNFIIDNNDKQYGTYVHVDTNHWKTVLSQIVKLDGIAAGSLRLFGDEPGRHAMFYRHLQSEYPIEVTARGLTINEWRPVRQNEDNHLLDALLYAYVAASIAGCHFVEQYVTQHVSNIKPLTFEGDKRTWKNQQ